MADYPNLPTGLGPGWVQILTAILTAVGLGSVIKIVAARWWDRELKHTDHSLESEKDFVKMLWAKLEKSDQESSRIESLLDKKNQELFDLRVELEMKKNRLELLLHENEDLRNQIKTQIEDNFKLRRALEDHLRDHHEFDN